ncbi:uncharacterized protein [Palaemon carinicauda]|uniref:uncharacterized protein n=1 Tax=Palaemon carinicauda TaxID=392227 RepID=UPI0035B5E9B2
MVRIITHLILLNLLVISCPKHCGASNHRLIETIDRHGTKQMYCGYLNETKEECMNQSNGSTVSKKMVCKEIQDPKDLKTKKGQNPKKTSTNVKGIARYVLGTLLVISVVLNASLVTYVIMLKRSIKSASNSLESKSSAMPPASCHECDNTYEEISDLPFCRSPPALPPPLRAESSHDSENSLYQKYLAEKAQEMNRSISSPNSICLSGDYVEVYREGPEEARIVGETAVAPVVGRDRDATTGLFGLDEACKFSNRTNPCSVRFGKT